MISGRRFVLTLLNQYVSIVVCSTAIGQFKYIALYQHKNIIKTTAKGSMFLIILFFFADSSLCVFRMFLIDAQCFWIFVSFLAIKDLEFSSIRLNVNNIKPQIKFNLL